MSVPYENFSETPSNLAEARPIHVPGKYKVAIGLLLLSLVIVSLMALQQANLSQLQNSQLSSHSSSLSNNLSDLNKIVSLEKSQVLANNHVVYWTAGMTGIRLDWYCRCFQYSGYLHMNWTSPNELSLRVVQFGLNFTTPSRAVADFKIPISSGEPFAASFVMASCSVQSECTATYSAVYHY
jgi:hypothetical protein